MNYKSRKVILTLLTTLILFLGGSLLYVHAQSKMNNQKIINALVRNYGERAGKRGQAWLNIMAQYQEVSEAERLFKVNNFFNMLFFIDDIKLWGEKNYWATPVEFIGVNGGDCEDFAIAKYFTLLELGVPDEKMRITMVKAVTLNQYHMVLAYYKTPGSIPIILDNIDGIIKPATQRKDLIPIYSFNGKQLWLNKEKGQGVVAGKSERLERWTNLNQRMGASNMKQPKLRME
ncbi:transglutaminase-like cysteine peptidase [Psychromonas ossibalaenae]|uniref:transglutaminase-like cysteine peptidase n=1 Tax=Psychromonas ossibalaenae TaxID=444922 RepID=UPI000477DB30